ncbi:hypothetical protein VPH35_054558 [Triticum aestivum]|uniref:Uncharacterized protein n=1 Tax=Triticum aestivum TaxID=4565 RepID=A0A077RYI1_WHEAT|nr:unnamed protein product [Triticum aestivum]
MAVTIDDGATASFWFSSWLSGSQLCLAYPTVFAQSICKNRSVREALHQDRWILDLRHGLEQSGNLGGLQLTGTHQLEHRNGVEGEFDKGQVESRDACVPPLLPSPPPVGVTGQSSCGLAAVRPSPPPSWSGAARAGRFEGVPAPWHLGRRSEEAHMVGRARRAFAGGGASWCSEACRARAEGEDKRGSEARGLARQREVVLRLWRCCGDSARERRGCARVLAAQICLQLGWEGCAHAARADRGFQRLPGEVRRAEGGGSAARARLVWRSSRPCSSDNSRREECNGRCRALFPRPGRYPVRAAAELPSSVAAVLPPTARRRLLRAGAELPPARPQSSLPSSMAYCARSRGAPSGADAELPPIVHRLLLRVAMLHLPPLARAGGPAQETARGLCVEVEHGARRRRGGWARGRRRRRRRRWGNGRTGRGHQVEHGARRREEPEAVVELLQLEGRAAPVALLLGEVVVLVLPLPPLRLAHGALDLHRQRWLAAHKLLDTMLHRNRDGMKMTM